MAQSPSPVSARGIFQGMLGAGVLVCLQDQLFAASEITETAYRRNAVPTGDLVGQLIQDRVEILRQYKRSARRGEEQPRKERGASFASLAETITIESLAADETAT